MIPDRQLTPALNTATRKNEKYSMSALVGIELREHSRESGSHISKLLDETYNGACLHMTFLWERRRAYLVLCRTPPDVHSGCANRDVGIRNKKRGPWSLTPSITHFKFISPPCVLYISVAFLRIKVSLTKRLDQVTNQLVEEKEMDWRFQSPPTPRALANGDRAILLRTGI
jgi:hypothetical protein